MTGVNDLLDGKEFCFPCMAIASLVHGALP